MSKLDIIRAWKDEEYRNSLNQEELAQIPNHPAGEIELSEGELGGIQGANGMATYYTITVCPILTITICPILTITVCPTFYYCV